jgi:hypothetical protein
VLLKWSESCLYPQWLPFIKCSFCARLSTEYFTRVWCNQGESPITQNLFQVLFYRQTDKIGDWSNNEPQTQDSNLDCVKPRSCLCYATSLKCSQCTLSLCELLISESMTIYFEN